MTNREQRIRRLVLDKAAEVSRRRSIDRREFLTSACGMATSLYMINVVGGCSNEGPFGVPEEAMEDAGMADAYLGTAGNELIVDMQTHFATPETSPLGALGLDAFGQRHDAAYPWIVRSPGVAGPGKYDRTEYIKQVLLGSDTTIGVLSGTPYSLGADGTGVSNFAALSNEDLVGGAAFLEEMFPGRILTQCMVMPNDRLDVQLAMMERSAGTHVTWKTYPAWSPDTASGHWLDSPEGQAMIQKGLDLDAPIFSIHKEFPLSNSSPAYANPKDVCSAAKLFPGAHFVVCHSGFEHGSVSMQPTGAYGSWSQGLSSYPEGPYPDDDPSDATLAVQYPADRGVNSLIKSLRDADIGPNGTNLDGSPGNTHVYAECGGVWPNLMTRPIEAQHYWGKLLKHIGEDRILWGTDCLRFGSPQPLIEGFRALTISVELQEKYGYPALTQVRKEKILGQNAARLLNLRGKRIMGCHSDYVPSA